MKLLINDEQAQAIGKELRQQEKKLVFTNGCFDILHAGHVRYLTQARQLGDCLMVAVNSDSSVRRLKGETRPVNNEADRAEVIDALRAVDYVIVFGDQTAQRLIELVKPEIYAKGGDYTPETLPESAAVQAYGGRIELLPLVPGRSTTGIINWLRY